MDKTKLDEIIEKHKAQPVGHGYIDIVVKRNNYKNFIYDLVNNGFTVESISWWEWCAEGKKTEYGVGGPTSDFYEGWFSELPHDIDDLNLSAKLEGDELAQQIINIIEAKTITYPNETVVFKEADWLTPALWLNVPDDWRNRCND